jgi:prepilin-type N-terminal cleavage/methylation domain-containing protein
MKARRGFTMIEVAIVLGLMALLLTPFLDLVVSVYRETQSLSVQADLMAEAERTANAVFRRAALGPYQLHPDNHGIRFADGSEVRFQDGTLRMGQQAALNPPPGVRFGGIPLQDFAVIRRDGVLTVHLCFQAPTRAGGPVEPRSFSFDWPAAGVPR